MKCGICKAEMEAKKVTHTEDLEQGVIVVRHVPSGGDWNKCMQFCISSDHAPRCDQTGRCKTASRPQGRQDG